MRGQMITKYILTAGELLTKARIGTDKHSNHGTLHAQRVLTTQNIYRNSNDWNSLPVPIWNIRQIKTFKTKLKKHLTT